MEDWEWTARVRLEHNPHVYYIEDRRAAQSVTGLLKGVFPPFNAQLALQRYAPSERPAVRLQWAAARDAGTAAHAEIERHFLCGDPLGTYLAACVPRALADMGIDRVAGVEVPVYDDSRTVAGMIDCVARAAGTDDIVLVDWKRTNGRFATEFRGNDSKLQQYSLQLHIYALLFEQRSGLRPARMYMVNIKPDNYECTPALDYRELAIKLVADAALA